MFNQKSLKRRLDELGDGPHCEDTTTNNLGAYSISTWSSPRSSASLHNNHLHVRSAMNPDYTSQDVSLETITSSETSYSHQYEKKLCFGMLKNIQIKFNRLRTQATPAFDHIDHDNEVFACLNFVLNEDRCELVSKDGIPLAMLNKKTHLALICLSSAAKSIDFKGLIPRKESDRRMSSISDPCCRIPVYVFGARGDADVVGRELSRYRLFLQHPSIHLYDATYENPHYLSLPGISFPNGTLLPPISSKYLDGGTGSPEKNGSVVHEETDVFTVIDDLPKQIYLKEAQIDARILTKLLPHQLEAVDFIMHREKPSELKPGSLWENDTFASGRSCYHHRITGAKSHVAADMMGGILADDMGLGKTLAMIAAITSSISHAENYANEMLQKGDMTQATSKVSTKSTLVIVPSPLILDGWVEELEKHVKSGSLAYYKFHGPSRSLNTSSSPPYHIVLTTYDTLKSDFSRRGSALSHFLWYRIVLDEAHVIRNTSTNTFQAVMSLSAVIRWCISGTPVQNSLDDLESLVKFLRVPMLDDSSMFRRFITGRILAVSTTRKPNYDNLRVLLTSICLRRSTSILSELGVSFEVHRPNLSESERSAYKKLETACKERIQAAVNFKGERGESTTVLTTILLLRIFCNTGVNSVLTPEGFLEQAQADEFSSLKLQQSGELDFMQRDADVAPSAVDSMQDKKRRQGILLSHECLSRSSIPAGHENPCLDVFSSDCEATGATQSEGQTGATTSFVNCTNTGQAQYPSKLVALLADVKEHYNKEKSIVFSYWRRSLDLVARLFDEQGIVYCRIDGAIDTAQRKIVLRQFHEDPLTRVLLITQSTGSVGLNNLSVASRVHILEPQWNPSIENQAIGRVLRLGQKKRVCIVRYIVQATIEEAVETRQHLKVQLASKGGLHSMDDPGSSERQRRINRVQELAKSLNLGLDD